MNVNDRNDFTMLSSRPRRGPTAATPILDSDNPRTAGAWFGRSQPPLLFDLVVAPGRNQIDTDSFAPGLVGRRCQVHAELLADAITAALPKATAPGR